MSVLRRLIDGHVWSQVGDVVKLVVNQNELFDLLEEEREATRRAYEAGYVDGENRRLPDFEMFYKNENE
jgi:hypothetical protein